MFDGLWRKKYVADIQTKSLVYQSKANLDEETLFGKVTHIEDPQIR